MTKRSTLMALVLSAGAAWAGYAADRLSGMDEATRENAVIDLEWAGPHTDAMAKAEFLWNTGKYAEAISAIEALEAELGDMCLGISWRKPIETESPKWDTDVQVTASAYDIYKVELVKAMGNNNLFVVAYGTGSTSWAYSWWTYISTNGGMSWSETYEWGANYRFYTGDAGEFSNGYIYIVYGGGGEVRVRRIDENTGAIDNSFGYKVAYTTTDTVLEVNFEPRRTTDTEMYIASIDKTHTLRYAYSVDGSSWTNRDPGISDAVGGLDMDWGYMTGSQHYLWLSYINTAGGLCAAGRMPGSWELHTNLITVYAGNPSTAIAMRGDTILVASTKQVSGDNMYVVYEITYDDGANWYWSTPVGTDDSTNHPDVTARGDQGWQMVYIEYHLNGPERIGYTHRTYQLGTWDTPAFLSEHDGWRWYRPSIDYLGSADQYGVVYIDDDYIAWFDRKDWSDVAEGAPRPLPMEFKAIPGPGRTTLSFVLPQAGFASLKIYDVKGALVRDLSGRYEEGMNRVEFVPAGSGTYFAILVAGDQTARTKFATVK